MNQRMLATTVALLSLVSLTAAPPRKARACGGSYTRSPQEVALAAVTEALRADNKDRFLTTGAAVIDGRTATANFEWTNPSSSRFVVVTVRTDGAGNRRFAVQIRATNPDLAGASFDAGDYDLLATVQTKLDKRKRTLNSFRAMSGTPSARVFVFERHSTREGRATLDLGDAGWRVASLDLGLRKAT